MKFAPVIPFEPVSTEQYPRGDKWVSQVKWDGVRVLVYYDGDHVNVMNRKRHNRTRQYPELADIRQYCSANTVILDGEVIALENGKPSFRRVMKRDGLRKSERINIVKYNIPITYMIFDVLYVNGNWVTDQPLQQRQQLLNNIITQNDFVQLVSNHGDAEALFNAVVTHDLEGIVIKDLNSKYAINGKDKRWQKKKNYKDLIAVVGGVTFRDSVVNAVLLGLYDDKKRLWYVGHAGTGKLTQSDWKNLTEKIKPLIINKSPLVNKPGRIKETIWLTPRITAKIQFAVWTIGRTLRQPSIQSFVDFSPDECIFE